MPSSHQDLLLRLAVTLGALAVYRLGAHVPLAGIDQALLAQLYRETGAALALERISVLALGVGPIISALLLVEVARLASRRFNDWAGAAPENTRRVHRYAVLGALLLAAVQGWGIAGTLEEMSHLVAEPGRLFRLMVVATLVAGTAFLVWLAAVISRYGLGSGLWILLLAPSLAGLPALTSGVIGAVRAGAVPQAGVIATLAYILIALATLAALARTLAELSMPLDRTLIWPLFIAQFPAGLLLIAPWLLPAGAMRDALAALLTWGAPLHLAALALIVYVVALAQWRCAAPRPAAAEPTSPSVEAVRPMALTALTLAAVAVVPELLARWLAVPLLIDGSQLTVAVAVALAILDQMRRRA